MSRSQLQILVVLSLLSPPLLVCGQGMGDPASRADEPTRKTPAMRERVYTRLAEAQECANNDDLDCAHELLGELREMDRLNSYEIAQIWILYANIYFNQENYPEAIRYYEMALEQPGLPLGLETGTLFTLMRLYMHQELFAESLETLLQWFAIEPNPGPEPYYYQGMINYQMQRYRNAIEPLLRAIEVAQTQAREVQESWYHLLYVSYYELEEYRNVISVLESMIDSWPKKAYFVQLSGMYGEVGEDFRQLALYETAFEAGWLESSTERVRLAQLFLRENIPLKAARIMETGLDEGAIEATETNWRVLAQAWQLAHEYENAIAPLQRAAELADNGELDLRIAQSYQSLYLWEECAAAARVALSKGDLRRPDQGSLMLGVCLFEMEEFDDARLAFETAEKDSRSRDSARDWLVYVNSEQNLAQRYLEALDDG